MAKRTHPTTEMMADLQQVFDKHNWSGAPIGVVKPQEMASGSLADDCPQLCPDGSTPKKYYYTTPDGEWKMICKCP